MPRKFLLGRKLGMTQMFDEGGQTIPLTAIECGPCHVLQVKTQAVDGYDAYQLGFEELARKVPVTKGRLGHFKKWKSKPMRVVREVRCQESDLPEAGAVIKAADAFEVGQLVHITGTTKGKGFQGVMRRHGFAGFKKTHGAMGNRLPGSIGQASYPSRVLKGVRMAGQMGNVRQTVRNLKVCKVDAENGVVFVRGAVPGCTGSLVEVTVADNGS